MAETPERADTAAESPERNAWLPSVRVYPWERSLLDEARALERVKMSEFIRRVLVDAARRRVARADR
jgi:uncharacterized protein (DUF1778 family)